MFPHTVTQRQMHNLKRHITSKVSFRPFPSAFPTSSLIPDLEQMTRKFVQKKWTYGIAATGVDTVFNPGGKAG